MPTNKKLFQCLNKKKQLRHFDGYIFNDKFSIL